MSLLNSNSSVLGSRLLHGKDIAVNHFAKLEREEEQRAFGLGLHFGDCGNDLGGLGRCAMATVRWFGGAEGGVDVVVVERLGVGSAGGHGGGGAGSVALVVMRR